MTGAPITIADVRALDASDSLACFRERFALPEDVIYLDGNSLGALPRSAPTQITGIVEKEWGRSLIRSWNDHDWIGAPARIGDKIASLLGAKAGEVIAADSTSVNLFKLGAPAFLYVAHHLQAALVSPIRGWMGHAAPFEFRDEYRPAPGIDRFLAGTPPILGLAGLEAGVDIALEADQQALFDKAQRMFALFAALMAERCPEFRLVSPAMAAERGSHISYAHPEARVIMNALIARGVIGDFRAPDIARFGLTPLYLRFEDIWHAVDTLADIMASGAWRSPEHARRGRVT